jgi:hypothetical protein
MEKRWICIVNPDLEENIASALEHFFSPRNKEWRDMARVFPLISPAKPMAEPAKTAQLNTRPRGKRLFPVERPCHAEPLARAADPVGAPSEREMYSTLFCKELPVVCTKVVTKERICHLVLRHHRSYPRGAQGV